MRAGIFAKTFEGEVPLDVLRAVRAAGFGSAQFNMACAGLPSLPDAVPAATLEAIRAAAAEAGVELCALSATANLIHPDTVERQKGIDSVAVLIEAAATLGIPLVTLCTGTRDPKDPWRHHPDNVRPDAWSDLRAALSTLLPKAEAAGVSLGMEPEQANVVTSAADARRLIHAMGSDRLAIVLDPANLFECATRSEARDIVARAVDEAGDAIAMAHAKDRHPDGRFTTAGTGVVDFADFVARLRAVGFDGPVVTHGLSAGEAPAVATFLAGLGVA